MQTGVPIFFFGGVVYSFFFIPLCPMGSLPRVLHIVSCVEFGQK